MIGDVSMEHRWIAITGGDLLGADCILLMTDHPEYKAIDPGIVGPGMRKRLLIDTRNCVKAEVWQRTGFRAIVLGNGKPG